MRYEKTHDPWRIHIAQEGYTVRDLEQYASELTGVIMSFLPSMEVLDFLISHNKPIVFVDTRQLELPATYRRYGYVYMNNQSIADMASEHLFARGFDRIAFVHDYFSSVYSIQRCDRLKEQTLKSNRQFFEFGRRTPFTEPEGGPDDRELAHWLRSLPKPTGILAANDFRARQILDICFTEGIDIPQDLAVLGVDDDSRICNISKPTLSSIGPNSEYGGFLAARMLDKLMRGHRHNPKKFVYYEPTGIVSRRSTQRILTPNPLVRAALEYIWDTGWKNGNVASTARHLRISVRRLETVFREVVGHTVVEEIQNTRYRQIVKLLRETDMSIAEITRQCGLTNKSNLIKKFRERYGVTMGRFRKEQRE